MPSYYLLRSMTGRLDQLQHLELFKEIPAFDTAYHRAGVKPASAEFANLVTQVLDVEEISAHLNFGGRYSHAGHSYGGSSASQAMDLLIEEIERLRKASKSIRSRHPKIAHQRLTLSVGATPTATSVQTLS
ncbi:MAG: hypothetical protein Q9176_000089 [Flavoplaca citrina]